MLKFILVFTILMFANIFASFLTPPQEKKHINAGVNYPQFHDIFAENNEFVKSKDKVESNMKTIAEKSTSESTGADDDYGGIKVDDQITSALDDYAFDNTGVGWVYYQFYNGPGCGAAIDGMFYNTGFKSGECIAISVGESYIITMAEEGTCSNLRAQWFKTVNCEPLSFIGAAHLEHFTECRNSADGTSYKGGCSGGEKFPILVDSTLQT